MLAPRTHAVTYLTLICVALGTSASRIAAQNADNPANKRVELQAEKMRQALEQRALRMLDVNRFDVAVRGVSTTFNLGIEVDKSIVMVSVELVPEEPKAAAATEIADGEPAAPRQPAAPRVARIAPVSFEQLAFGSHTDDSVARVKLLSRLRKKVEDVDLTCRLTEAQQKKLKLAGRGDIERYFDRVEDLRVKSQNIPMAGDEANVRNWLTGVKEFCREAEPLRRVLDSGPFEDNSLFAKTLKKTLSAEQAAKFAERKARASEKNAVKSSQKAKSAK